MYIKSFTEIIVLALIICGCSTYDKDSERNKNNGFFGSITGLARGDYEARDRDLIVPKPKYDFYIELPPREIGLAAWQSSQRHRNLGRSIDQDHAYGSYKIQSVFFATDRNLTGSEDPNDMFGVDRSELRYGECQVSIPENHKVGEIESPTALDFSFSEDTTKHIVLLKIDIKSKKVFFENIREYKNSDALIFIHGYNVSFIDAAKRTAQLSYDLNFEGIPIFYSWPSQSRELSYPIDEQNVEWTKTNLKEFLKDFFEYSEAEKINIISHSMGNRALVRALTELLSENESIKGRLKEIILAAPDIDSDVFKRDIAPTLISKSNSITLYASSKDVALSASKKFHGYPRIGDTSHMNLVSGIEMIDASNVDTSFLGHSYFSKDRSLISDIFYIINNNQRADQRFGLRRIDLKNGHYWIFKK